MSIFPTFAPCNFPHNHKIVICFKNCICSPYRWAIFFLVPGVRLVGVSWCVFAVLLGYCFPNASRNSRPTTSPHDLAPVARCIIFCRSLMLYIVLKYPIASPLSVIPVSAQTAFSIMSIIDGGLIGCCFAFGVVFLVLIYFVIFREILAFAPMLARFALVPLYVAILNSSPHI